MTTERDDEIEQAMWGADGISGLYGSDCDEAFRRGWRHGFEAGQGDIQRWSNLPHATDETICERCGERGHYWCIDSRILVTGRGVPNVYPSDFEGFEDEDDSEPPRGEGAMSE